MISEAITSKDLTAIRKVFKSSNMTIKEISEILNLSDTTVGNYINMFKLIDSKNYKDAIELGYRRKFSKSRISEVFNACGVTMPEDNEPAKEVQEQVKTQMQNKENDELLLTAKLILQQERKTEELLEQLMDVVIKNYTSSIVNAIDTLHEQNKDILFAINAIKKTLD